MLVAPGRDFVYLFTNCNIDKSDYSIYYYCSRGVPCGAVCVKEENSDGNEKHSEKRQYP